MREGSTECFAYQNISTDPFVMILVPLERGGSRRHFELLRIKIHRRSSEISSLKVTVPTMVGTVPKGLSNFWRNPMSLSEKYPI